MGHHQQIVLLALLVCITITKIIVVSLATLMAIIFQGQIAINAIQVVWLVMDHPQRIALPAPWVHIITAKIIAVLPAT